MRTDDEGRIPIPAQRIFTAARLRLDTHTLARAFVVANNITVLQLSINSVGIFGIDLGAKAVAALGNKPITVDDARRIAGARRPAECEIVLRTAIDVIEGLGVVGGHIIELGYRQISFEVPVRAAVITFINAAVAADQIMIRIVRVDPDLVIVYVLGFFPESPQGFAAII